MQCYIYSSKYRKVRYEAGNGGIYVNCFRLDLLQIYVLTSRTIKFGVRFVEANKLSKLRHDKAGRCFGITFDDGTNVFGERILLKFLGHTYFGLY